MTGMCLREDIGNITCSSNSDCPEGSFCDTSQKTCQDPYDAACDRVTDCGTMARCTCTECEGQGACEPIININKPCDSDNNCGEYFTYGD